MDVPCDGTVHTFLVYWGWTFSGAQNNPCRVGRFFGVLCDDYKSENDCNNDAVADEVKWNTYPIKMTGDDDAAAAAAAAVAAADDDDDDDYDDERPD